MTFMMFVALWRLSHYDVCHIVTYVALWCLLVMMFVDLWHLSPYDVCRLITFVALWHLSVMTFVPLWCLLLMRFNGMSLMTFVAVPLRILPSQASRAASLAIHSEYYQARRVEQLAWRYMQKASQHRQNIRAEELAIHTFRVLLSQACQLCHKNFS